MQVKYAIFDMDGTLLDSMYVWDHVGQTVLQKHGISMPKELRKRMRNMTTEEVALYFQKLGMTEPVEDIIKEINEVPYERYLHEVQPKPGAVEFLHQLYRQGTPMCIVSSTDTSSIHAAFDRLQLTDLFSFILSANDFGSGKDRPEIFYEAAQRLGGRPEETVVFEDALYSIRTAKTAGFPVVALQDEEARGESEEIRKLADLYLPDLRSFPWEGESQI